MAKKKVAVIHTFLYSVEDLKALFAKYIPDAEMINIIDDSLLQEALANKGITNNARARYVKYAENAQQLGCDVILNQCSSYGECADFAAQAVNVPTPHAHCAALSFPLVAASTRPPATTSACRKPGHSAM